MKALVTGGAGFIGSHLVERLLQDGHSATVLDNLSSGKKSNLEFAYKNSTFDPVSPAPDTRHPAPDTLFRFIEDDICNYDACVEATKGVDVIFHEAALKSVPQSMERPYEYNEVNINGTLNLLTAARQNKVKRFIFASSSSVYGDVSEFPQKEDAYPQLISPYALTKLAGEYYCRIFSTHYGLECVSLRYFNIYGPRQALDDEYAVVIPKFIHCLLNSQDPPIFGTGKQSRDFTYINNVVAANLLAAKATGVAGRVFNIATGVDHTVLELVNALNEIMGTTIKPIHCPPRAGDVFKSQADISQARQFLGYKPLIGFREGLEKTVEYFAKGYRVSGARGREK